MGEINNKSNVAPGTTTSENVGSSKIEAKVTYDFYNFTREEIKKDLAIREKEPWQINQSHTSLCGMAVVAFFYAKKEYTDYKQFVLDLHAYGKATSATGYTVTTDTDKHLEVYKPGDGKYPPKMPPADYILLTVLRDFQNGMFDYDPNGDDGGNISEGGAGFSIPSDVSKLMKGLIGLEVYDDTNIAVSVPTDKTIVSYLQSIQTKLTNGYCIAMLINMDMLFNRKSFFTTPNHWIGIIDLDYDAKSKMVFIKSFTWGWNPEDKRNQPFRMSFDVFIDGCFGYIEGK